MPPFTLPTDGRITPEWHKALVLQQDPDDDEAEQAIRMEVERRAERDLAAALAKQESAVLASAPTSAPEAVERAQAAGERVSDILRRMLQQSADLGVSVAVDQFNRIGFGFDWTLANQSAAEWVNRYTFDLVSGINATTEHRLRTAVDVWINNGEPLSQLRRELQPIFGRARAELIASTEVTRAYAEGNLQAYRASGAADGIEWRTANDERVCPICGPLHHERGTIDGGIGPAGMIPPAHPRCRCWIVPVVAEPGDTVPASVTPVPEWSPSMARAQADLWADNSAIRGDVYHVTPGVANERSIRENGFSLSKQKFGRMWGDGVYVGTDELSAAQYERWIGRSARTMKLKVNVSNPFVYNADTPTFKPDDIISKALGIPKAKARQALNKSTINELLSGAGYDALQILPGSGLTPAAVEAFGGSQVVVFDPRNVVVING